MHTGKSILATRGRPIHAEARQTVPSSMVDGQPAAISIKLVILPRTRIGLGREGLRRHLETIHGPMVAADPHVRQVFRGYVHHYVQDSPVRDLAELKERDAVTIIRFGSAQDMIASKASAGYRDRIGPDEDNFREVEGSVGLSAQEIVVLPGLEQAARKIFVFRRLPEVDEAQLSGWVDRLAELQGVAGLTGIVTNSARLVQGDFDLLQFDEIGLADGADATALVEQVARLAGQYFGGTESFHLFVEPVIFI